MSLPIKSKTDLMAWFKEACDRCKKVYIDAVIEYVAAHEDEIKEKLLKGEQVPINVNIYDRLCPRCKGLLKKHTKVWIDEDELKEMLFGGVKRAGKRE